MQRELLPPSWLATGEILLLTNLMQSNCFSSVKLDWGKIALSHRFASDCEQLNLSPGLLSIGSVKAIAFGAF